MKCPVCKGNIPALDRWFDVNENTRYDCIDVNCPGQIVIPKSATKIKIHSLKKVKPKKPSTYIDEFLRLKCAGDVINVCTPVNKFRKEISEAMGIVKEVRKIALKSPMKYRLYDLCAGNSLASVISAHLLPVKYSVAIDKRNRKRQWNNVKNFQYWQKDIHDWNYTLEFECFINLKSIITSIHPCGDLAEQVIKIYNNSNTSHLVLMPCCISPGFKSNLPKEVISKIGKDMAWAIHLANLCNGKIKVDPKILSPKNIIITAKK